MDTNEDKQYCTEYTGYEMMLISASREVKKDDIIFNAFHWPFLVVHIARLVHFPELFNVIEIGVTKDKLIQPTKMPYSTATTGFPLLWAPREATVRNLKIS